ncbi:MAG: GMC family oxidoreductase [Rhodospirillales bacterium]
MSEDYESDVAVIGAGVAGSLVAAKLAGGPSVILVEAGPRIDRQAAVETFWRAPIKLPESPYPLSEAYPHPVSGDPDGWYQQTGPDAFGSTYLRAVGGTTWHWLGTALRFLPEDFRLRSRFGRGLDWPLSYADLEPWYADAETVLGVAGNAEDDLGSPRSGPFPLPEIPASFVDSTFAKALAGTPYAAVRPTPQARNSVDYQDRPVCCGSGSCIPICPVQAKWDATVAVAEAEAKGARLLESSVVVGLDCDPKGRILLARIKRPDGSEASLRAKVFVLAAHGIESPRLLLNSASEVYPRGLANRSDQVGRNLMDHPVQLSWALAADPVWPYRGPLATSGIETFRSGAFRAERPAYRIEISNHGWNWPTGAPLTTADRLAKEGLTGKALQAALYSQTSRHLSLAALTEQLPDPENRIDLSPDSRDIYGVPRPRIAYRLDDYTRAGLAEAARVQGEIFGLMGASRVRHAQHFFPAGHIMGTVRMGEDPDRSVVDPDLRAHDHPNLFVLGSGAFPTGAVANPTLTIAALSLRAVAPIRDSLSL